MREEDNNMSLNDILNEKLYYNKYILMHNKPSTNKLSTINNAESINDLLNFDMSI